MNQKTLRSGHEPKGGGGGELQHRKFLGKANLPNKIHICNTEGEVYL